MMEETIARPVIGITGNFDNPNCLLGNAYYQSVIRAGGTPVIIPPFRMNESTEQLLDDYLDRIDGILFSGGADLNPLLLGEQPLPQLHGINTERDEQELQLMKKAYNRQLPVLGICRGIQVMAAALGGEIHQDIYVAQQQGEPRYLTPMFKHSQEASRDTLSHTVKIDPDTILHAIYQTSVLPVNSFHHQAVKTAPEGFRVSATSLDGVIEAIESTEYKSVLGVQWHPECLQKTTDKDVFDWLVKEAESFAKARKLHQRILSLDSHCDTPTRIIRNKFDDFFDRPCDEPFLKELNANFQNFNEQFSLREPRLQVDLPKMSEGMLDASFMVAYLRQGERDDASLRDATIRADYILSLVEQLVAANSDRVGLARTPDDMYRLKFEGKRAIVLGIENGYAVGKDLKNVERFSQRGVAYMTLCHNGDNDICDSNKGNAEHGGISLFGEKVIQEMNRLGMMVDLSHAADSSFYDALRISQKPIICSHSSARSLCAHPRNLTDEQMRDLAKSGGVAQVTIYTHFLQENGNATVHDIVNHLNHMVKVMGVEHVGIGTDFDGGGGVPGCNCASELVNFTRLLLAQRYCEADLRLLWGENFLRVMRENQNCG